MPWRPPEADPYVGLTDDAVLREAVTARSEQRERRQRASELATWIGTLRDLAERARPVVLRITDQRSHRGTIAAVGVDHLAVSLFAGSLALVRTEAVRAVRPEPGEPAPVAMGDRERSQDRTLAEALERVHEDRRRIAVGLFDLDEPVAGEAAALGEDVLTLRVDGAERGTLYVPLDAVREVVVER